MTFSLPTSFDLNDELKAIMPPDAIPAAGTYIVTLTIQDELNIIYKELLIDPDQVKRLSFPWFLGDNAPRSR